MKNICIIGSLNVDLTVRIPRFHLPGETIQATSFSTYTGGKGGNQAVAAAKLGSSVLMVGKLGNDQNGEFYRQTLRSYRIDDQGVETIESVSSGTALIEVDQNGENRIAIVSGANALVNKEQIDRLLPAILQYDIFLFQLEIPMETVEYAANLLHEYGKCVVLDPAPAVTLSAELLGHIHYLTPNSTELALLSGMPTDTMSQTVLACRKLLAQGVQTVVAKLGEHGCMLVDNSHFIHIPGYCVNVVDTTAAGDSFNAGLATALARDESLENALRYANAVGALSTTGAGAQSVMPTHTQVMHLLHCQKPFM